MHVLSAAMTLFSATSALGGKAVSSEPANNELYSLRESNDSATDRLLQIGTQPTDAGSILGGNVYDGLLSQSKRRLQSFYIKVFELPLGANASEANGDKAWFVAGDQNGQYVEPALKEITESCNATELVGDDYEAAYNTDSWNTPIVEFGDSDDEDYFAVTTTPAFDGNADIYALNCIKNVSTIIYENISAVSNENEVQKDTGLSVDDMILIGLCSCTFLISLMICCITIFGVNPSTLHRNATAGGASGSGNSGMGTGVALGI